MNETSVRVVPGRDEEKAIKSRYTKAGLAILTDFIIFQIFSRLMLLITGLASGGGSITELMEKGSEIVSQSDYTSVLFSIGFPILAELAAIFMGVVTLNIDLKSKFTRNGYNVKEIAGGTAVGFFMQTAAAFIIMIIYVIYTFSGGNMDGISENAIVRKDSLGANIILYFYVCILGPIIEEVLFRGIVLESVRMYNERFAIVFSALIFGLMHGNITQAANGFLAGLVLGALYVRSGSLVPSSVMHILMNSVTSLISVMMFTNPNIIEDMTRDPRSALTGIPMAGIALNLIIRVVSIPAGIVILAVSSGNGFGIRKANAAGKRRAAPLVFTTVPWIIVIILYTAVIIYNF